MGKNARIIAIALTGLLAFGALQLWMARTKPVIKVVEYDPYSRESLQPAAEKLNKSLPKMVDDTTRLDSATAEDRLLTYRYTLTAESKEAVDTEAYRKKQLAIVARTACIHYREPFDRGMTMRYIYRDKAGQPLFEMDLNKAACAAQQAAK